MTIEVHINYVRYYPNMGQCVNDAQSLMMYSKKKNSWM